MAGPGQRAASGCVAGAPLRPPPYKREDAAGLQDADPGMSRKKQETFSRIRHHRRAQVGSKEHKKDELRRKMQFQVVKCQQES